MTEQGKTRDKETSAAYLAATGGDAASYPVGTRLDSDGVIAEVVGADGTTRTVRAGGKDRTASVAQIDVLVQRGVAKVIA